MTGNPNSPTQLPAPSFRSHGPWHGSCAVVVVEREVDSEVEAEVILLVCVEVVGASVLVEVVDVDVVEDVEDVEEVDVVDVVVPRSGRMPDTRRSPTTKAGHP